jgi:Zn-dependent M28 family amino/carboxypeptidase
MQRERQAASQAWNQRLSNVGFSGRGGAGRLARRLEQAGAAGVITSRWSNGWGVQKIFSASTEQVPTLDLGCEDYGLVFRLAENDQSPVLEVFADAEFLGEGPVFNTIATIPGRELPNEYVMLSAHFDSWDGGSGATDNGTGTITMLEAMRILSTVYPNPKRTILVGHWSGEEQGLNGSRGFAEDNPKVVDGLQALFNQDNGTGRVVRISAQGLTGASANFANWLSQIPTEITRHITFSFPGTPSGGGTDHASFICSGAPAFSLGALGWNYGTYTWHTQRDTFDKISFDDLKNNATLTAMLVYLASEDAERVSRERRMVMPVRGGRQMTWPECQPARRDWSQRR